MDGPPPTVADLLARDHRRLDDLFGRFLGAADRESAARAIADFDAALRAHTSLEEEHLFGAVPGGKLVALPDESERDRLFRELTLEHVQIRELSGMIVRQLGEGGNPGVALSLAGSLARRWDAHTAREESECHRFFGGSLDPAREADLRKALEPES
jgi:Hemerythrin HHE cation binding domain